MPRPRDWRGRGTPTKENPLMLRTSLHHHTPRKLTLAARILAAVASIAVVGFVGCAPSYEDQRPPVDKLDPRDRGLQSKDVQQASDKLAMDLLSLDELNDSKTQWTIVVDRVEDRTNSRLFTGNFDIFLQRLKTNIQREGKGRIRIIDNRDRFYDVRDRELEGGRGDEFGQGPASGPPAAAGARNPDYALRGTAMDLPNRGTVYYNLQFELINLRTRQSEWSNDYEVKTSR
jgi:hypothetical protein